MGQCSLRDLVGLLLIMSENEGFIDPKHQLLFGFHNLEKIMDINILAIFPRSLTSFKAEVDGIE